MTRLARVARPGPPALAMGGWLFAELAAVLMIVAMASADPGVAAVSDPPVRATPQVLVPSDPSPGVLLTPVEFRIEVPSSGGEAATTERFRTELNRVVGPDRQVGLVLMFGVSRDPEVPLAGSEVSRRLAEIVRGLPALSTAADIRPYLGDSEDGGPGEVRVEMFLLTGSSR